MRYIAPEERAFGVGFLERLEDNTKKVSLTKGPEPRDVLESIKRNLSNILNSHTGGAESAPSLGLIDFNDATLEATDLSVHIKMAIRICLEKYEPRLKNISVQVEPDFVNPLALRFRIEATLNSEALHDKVKISLLLDRNRHYQVI